MGSDSGSIGTSYVLGELLAAGGMAEIYSARPVGRAFDRPIVAKRMLSHLAPQQSYIDMFVDEARLSTRLDHPNIVQVYDFEATSRGLFLIMEQINGPDLLAVLSQSVRQRLPMPRELAVYITCHVLEALDYAHGVAENGRCLHVVHRDVSPGNVLVSRSGHVKLADFGIARASLQQQGTAVGTLKGKYSYMSPEQISGERLDGRSDVFSTGVVLAEMLLGRKLFAAASDLDLLLMVRRADLSRFDKYGGQIPRPLAQIVRRALAANRDDRYATAAEFRDALVEWLAVSPKRPSANRLAQYISALEKAVGDITRLKSRAHPGQASAMTISRTQTRMSRVAGEQAQALARSRFESALPVHKDGEVLQLVEEDLISRPRTPTPTPPPAARTNHRDAARTNHRDAARLTDLPLELGSLADVHGVEVLCEIARRQLTGKLSLQHGKWVKEAYFRDGNPDFVGSNIPGERFGQYLLRKKVISEAELARVIAALAHFDGRIGKALVSLNVLRPVDAVRLLEAQVMSRLVEACTWREGTFAFEAGQTNPHPALRLPFVTVEIIGKCEHPIPDAALKAWLARHRATRPIADARLASKLGLGRPILNVLLTADSTRSLDELARRGFAEGMARGVLAAMYLLWRCGGLDLAQSRAPARLAEQARTAVSPPPRGLLRKTARTAHTTQRGTRYEPARAQPRANVTCAGLLRFNCERRPKRSRVTEIPMTLRDVSFDGIGLQVSDGEPFVPGNGDQVTLRFYNGRTQIEIPAQVMWAHSGPGRDLGVRLRLAATPASIRTEYVRWVREHIVRVMTTPR